MKKSELRQFIREIITEAEIDASGNLVGFGGGDWKSQVDSYDHIHFFIEPQDADPLMDKLIMAGIDMVDSYPYKGAHLLRVSLGSNAAADLVKAEKIVGQSAKKGSPEDLGEGFGDQVGAALKGAGQGVASVLDVVLGAVVIVGILILKGAAALASGVLTIAGLGAYGLMGAIDKFILVPKVNATLRRLSEDEEVMAIAMKPTASGLRKVASEKLTTSERIMVGNFIKSNITRDMLGVSRRYRGGKTVGVKSKKGPGLKPGDETPLSPFGFE